MTDEDRASEVAGHCDHLPDGTCMVCVAAAIAAERAECVELARAFARGAEYDGPNAVQQAADDIADALQSRGNK